MACCEPGGEPPRRLRDRVGLADADRVEAVGAGALDQREAQALALAGPQKSRSS